MARTSKTTEEECRGLEMGIANMASSNSRAMIQWMEMSSWNLKMQEQDIIHLITFEWLRKENI